MKLNESDNKNINVICIELNEYLINRFKYKSVQPGSRTYGPGTVCCRDSGRQDGRKGDRVRSGLPFWLPAEGRC